MVRILVADDHAVVREGVKRLIDETSDMRVEGEARNAQEVFAAVEARSWDIILLDISMPGPNGLEVLQRLKRSHPKLPVLVYSMHPERHYAMRAFKAGAAGYLTKNSLAQELLTALRKAVQGGRYVTQALAEHLVLEATTDTEQPLHASLSDREYQVLCMLASGVTVAEISEEMLLSVKTISTYRNRILEKFGMDTTAELIHYAIQHGLV